MKRFFTILLCLMLSLSSFCIFGCNGGEQKLSLYVPDGAPALSVARLLHDENAVKDVKVNVVTSDLIKTFVTGESPKADFCIMPVNLAVKLLGSGENYQMLGVVTNGNLFIMKKQNGVDITKENASELIGKKVGVINIANVPGLTFKAILSDLSLDYVELTEETSYQEDKVNLVGLADGTEVKPTSDCDYFVVPEPAATTKQNATQGKLSIAGSLQSLYGQGQGYPQAVLVAKKQVIQNNKAVVEQLINSFAQNSAWLIDENTSMQAVVDAVRSGFVDQELTPTFTANNLNKTVITNCAIRFSTASSQKLLVKEYIIKLNAISNGAWGTPQDAFFYQA